MSKIKFGTIIEAKKPVDRGQLVVLKKIGLVETANIILISKIYWIKTIYGS